MHLPIFVVAMDRMFSIGFAALFFRNNRWLLHTHNCCAVTKWVRCLGHFAFGADSQTRFAFERVFEQKRFEAGFAKGYRLPSCTGG